MQYRQWINFVTLCHILIVQVKGTPEYSLMSFKEYQNQCQTKVCAFHSMGEKIKQGLTTESGDADLLGFEDGLTLKQRKEDLAILLNALSTNIVVMKEFETNLSLKDIPRDIANDIILELKVFLSVLSTHAEKVRDIKAKQEYAKTKFIEGGGSEWRTGKFVYLISAINSYLYDIKCYLQIHSETVKDICYHLSALNNHLEQFSTCYTINLEQQANCELLPDGSDDSSDT